MAARRMTRSSRALILFLTTSSSSRAGVACSGARLQQRRRRRPRRHRVETLLIEYFDVTEEACEACSALLAAIGAARRHHLTLRRLLLRLDGGDDDDAKDALARHVRLDNPLSPGSLSEFHDVHAGAPRWRRASPRRSAAPQAGARAAHGRGHGRGGARRRVRGGHRRRGGPRRARPRGDRRRRRGVRRHTAARAVVGQEGGGEGELAALRARRRDAGRGGARAYIVGRDLDTVSRMVRRAHDELEHGRDVARIAMRGHGERPLLQEVAREEEECEEDLRAQLAELEEHVCLCLITINRTRRLVAHEMARGLPPPSPATMTTTSEERLTSS